MGPGPSIWGARRRQKFLPHQTPTRLAASSAKPKKSARQQNPFSLEIVKMRVVLVSGGVISGVGKGEFFFFPALFPVLSQLLVGCGAPAREHKAKPELPLHEIYFYLPRDATRCPGLGGK